MGPPPPYRGPARSRIAGPPGTAAAPGCAGTDWRRCRTASWGLQEAGFIREQPVARYPQIVGRDGGLVRIQPTPFLLQSHDRAQTGFEGLRDIDAHAARFIEQLHIHE